MAISRPALPAGRPKHQAADGQCRQERVGQRTPAFWLALLLLVFLTQFTNWFPGREGRLSEGLTPPPSVTGFYTIAARAAGQFSALRRRAESEEG
jgi:hypothetical protein